MTSGAAFPPSCFQPLCLTCLPLPLHPLPFRVVAERRRITLDSLSCGDGACATHPPPRVRVQGPRGRTCISTLAPHFPPPRLPAFSPHPPISPPRGIPPRCRRLEHCPTYRFPFNPPPLAVCVAETHHWLSAGAPQSARQGSPPPLASPPSPCKRTTTPCFSPAPSSSSSSQKNAHPAQHLHAPPPHLHTCMCAASWRGRALLGSTRWEPPHQQQMVAAGAQTSSLCHLVCVGLSPSLSLLCRRRPFLSCPLPCLLLPSFYYLPFCFPLVGLLVSLRLLLKGPTALQSSTDLASAAPAVLLFPSPLPPPSTFRRPSFFYSVYMPPFLLLSSKGAVARRLVAGAAL